MYTLPLGIVFINSIEVRTVKLMDVPVCCSKVSHRDEQACAAIHNFIVNGAIEIKTSSAAFKPHVTNALSSITIRPEFLHGVEQWLHQLPGRLHILYQPWGPSFIDVITYNTLSFTVGNSIVCPSLPFGVGILATSINPGISLPNHCPILPKYDRVLNKY